MIFIVAAILLILVIWSLGRGMDIVEFAWKNRKIKEPCPYCGSWEHRKSYHTPGASR